MQEMLIWKCLSDLKRSVGNNSLPTTTKSDDGKILRVVDGKPTWVKLKDVSEVGL